MKEESHNPRIDPELEARIVALVLGEASDFERDELDRLIGERPELAAFKEQIQSVHGLLRDVATGESVAEDDDWKLSAEKRSAVLAVISGEVEEQPARQVVNNSAKKRKTVTGNFFWKFTKVAAVLCVVAITGSLAVLELFNSASPESAPVGQLASSEEATPDSRDAWEYRFVEGSGLRGKPIRMDDAIIIAADEEHFRTAAPAAVAEFDYEKSSTSALSAIRGSLGHYAAASIEGMNGSEPPSQQTADLSDLMAQGLELTYAVPPTGVGDRRGLSAFSVNGMGGKVTSGSAHPAKGKAEWSDGHLEELEAAVPPSIADESGPGVESSRGQSLKRGGRRLKASDDVGDLPAVGRAAETDGSVAAGESVVGDEFGGGMGGMGGGMGGGLGLAGKTLADGSGISAGSEPKGVAPPAIEVRRSGSKRPEAALSEPLVADTSGWRERKEAEGSSSDEVLGTGSRANSLPSPTNKQVDSKVDHERMGRLPAAERYKEDLAWEKGTMTSDDGITFPKSHALNGGEFYDRRISEPVKGTAVGQPRGESMAEPAKQDDRWGYAQNSNEDIRRGGGKSATSPRLRLKTKETDQPTTTTRAGVTHETEKRVKNSLGELSALSELHRNANVAGDLLLDDYDTKEEGPQPQLKLKDEQDELLRQRGRPAIAGESHWYRYDLPMLEDNSGSKAPAKKSTAPAGLNEKKAENESFSTFSLHVSDVSFKLARAALAHGEWPEAAKVRIEEFVNAFDYGDPMPSQSEKVACCLEQSIHPFLQQRNLLRISMRTAAAGRSSKIPLRLTFLLDNSGSMERIDRQQTVRRAFALLAQQLKPIDQVTLISFARGPRLLADKVSGSQSHQLVQLIDDLPSEGGTNIEAALQLGFEKAQEQQVDNAQNRIILLTDGAVNLGDANPESLSQMVTTMRNAGIAFDAAGISAEGLNDEILEALTRQGDGRYYLLDSPETADDGFARQIAGALRPSAKNVKVQIKFNPRRVGRYKLLGFEKHRLKQEDFRNDKVDAAEMAAAEAGVAVYQFEAKPDGEGDVGSVSVRFRDLSTGQMIENRWPIPYQADAPRPDQATPSLRIATSAALLAARLRGGPLGETVDLKTLSNLIAGLPDRDRNANRVQELQLMIQQARQVSGN